MILDWLLLAALAYLLSVVALAGWRDASDRPLPSRLRTALAIYVTPAAAIVAAGLDLWARVRDR